MRGARERLALSSRGSPVLRRWSIGAVLLLAGLAVRLVLLPDGGTHDVAYDVAWGRATNRAGFAHFYYGNYFPLQYHVFQLAAGLSGRLGMSGETILKLIEVLFDAGLLAVLALLARRMGLGDGLAVLYWLLPYTLAMDWLGYVDFDVAFFALLGVLILSGGRGAGRLLAAGCAFGAALMTKPQALTLALMFVGLVLFGAVWSKRRRELLRDAALLVVGPLAFGVGYSLWLASSGRGILYLGRTLVEFDRFQGAALSANMTNVWLVVAEAYRHGGRPLYAVAGPRYGLLEAVAAAVTALLLLVAVIVVARRIDERPLHESLVLVFAAGTLILPMTMTRAHENHLFLGVVFGLVAGAILRSRTFWWSFHLIVLIQFLALVSLYHLGDSGPYWPWLWRAGDYFVGHLWAPTAALTFAAFCAAYAALLARLGRPLVRESSDSSAPRRA